MGNNAVILKYTAKRIMVICSTFHLFNVENIRKFSQLWNNEHICYVNEPKVLNVYKGSQTFKQLGKLKHEEKDS